METQNLEKIIPATDAEKLVEATKMHAESAEGKEMKGEDLAKKAIQSVSGQVPVPSPSQSSSIQDPLTSYASHESEEVKHKIEDLLQTAATKGIVSATEDARRASPFILDAFHDALAAKVYPYLKEKGLLK